MRKSLCLLLVMALILSTVAVIAYADPVEPRAATCDGCGKTLTSRTVYKFSTPIGYCRDNSSYYHRYRREYRQQYCKTCNIVYSETFVQQKEYCDYDVAVANHGHTN